MGARPRSRPPPRRTGQRRTSRASRARRLLHVVVVVFVVVLVVVLVVVFVVVVVVGIRGSAVQGGGTVDPPHPLPRKICRTHPKDRRRTRRPRRIPRSPRACGIPLVQHPNALGVARGQVRDGHLLKPRHRVRETGRLRAQSFGRRTRVVSRVLEARRGWRNVDGGDGGDGTGRFGVVVPGVGVYLLQLENPSHRLWSGHRGERRAFALAAASALAARLSRSAA